VEGVKQMDESYEIPDEGINFDDVLVRKGSRLMTKPLAYELITQLTSVN
jgi:hypothetical protein